MDDDNMILFVCTGNTCRSPMAAALFQKLNTRQNLRVGSCGLTAMYGDLPSAMAVKALQMDFGIDISGHSSRPVTESFLGQAEYILTMTPVQRDVMRRAYPEQADRILTVGDLAGEPDQSVDDPFGQDLQSYRSTAALLARLIEKIIEKIS